MNSGAKREGREEGPADENSRRDFLKKGSLGLGGIAGTAAMGFQAAQVQAQESSSGKKLLQDLQANSSTLPREILPEPQLPECGCFKEIGFGYQKLLRVRIGLGSEVI